MNRASRLNMPSYRDPRYLQVAILLGYALAAREFFHFERSHWITLSCCFWSVVMDLALGKWIYRKLNFPLSAVITALACSLLIDARSAFPYLAAVTLASVSKAFLTYKGRHFINPACFGVVVLLRLAPSWVTGMPDLFSGYFLPSAVFAVLGLGTVVYAEQLSTSLAWICGFTIFAILRAVVFHASLSFALSPLLAPAFLLFTFHMISDPATSPRSVRFRMMFGLLIALIDAVFRAVQIPYGSFYAAFFACALLPWIREAEERFMKFEVGAGQKQSAAA